MKGNIIKDPFLRAALQSCGLICALSVILCAAAAALTRAGVLLPGSLMQAATVIQGVSVLVGSCIAAKRAPKRKLPAALLAAAAYLAICMLARLLFFGAWEVQALPGVIAASGAALIGALIGCGQQGKGRKKRR